MENIKDVVREKYAEAALRVRTGGSSRCGANAAAECCDPITSHLYDQKQFSPGPASMSMRSRRWSMENS